MKTLFIPTLALFAGLGCSNAFAAGPLEEWEMTTTTLGADGAMPAQKMLVCRKHEDTAKPPLQPNCKYSGSGGSGAHGTFVMECSGEHPFTMKGEGTQTATSMEGTMTILSSSMEIRSSYTGKRTGSCEVEGAKILSGAGTPGGSGMSAGVPSGMDRSGQMQMLNNPPPYARGRPQPPTAAGTASAAGDPPPADEKPDTAAEKAKKALKKLLPF